MFVFCIVAIPQQERSKKMTLANSTEFQNSNVERPDPRERILEYFEEHPPEFLNFRQAKQMGWHRTDCATIDELYFQYVQQQVVHWHHLDDILSQSRHARDLVSEAQVAVARRPDLGGREKSKLLARLGVQKKRTANSWGRQGSPRFFGQGCLHGSARSATAQPG